MPLIVQRTHFACWISKATDIHPGHAVAQWLRHCATNRKVTGFIPGSVIGIFH
jgi:hypothetical protein